MGVNVGFNLYVPSQIFSPMQFLIYNKHFPAIHAIMIQPITYIFFLFMLILLPAIGADAANTISERVVHSDSIDALCSTDKYIFTASFDGHIKKCTRDSIEEIGAHRDWVRSLLCINDNVISASNDGRIIIWNGTSISNQVSAHDWWITDIAFHKDTIVSVSLDETVKIWRYPDLELVYQHKIYGSYKHHTVTVCQNKAFIGSTWVISVLDLATRKWIFQNKGFDNFNVFLASTASDNTVYLGDNTGKVYRFDAFSSKLVSSAHVSNAAIKALAYHQGTLFVGDDEGNLKTIDAESLANTVVLASFPQAVRAILVRDDTVFAGCDGGILRAIRIDED